MKVFAKVFLFINGVVLVLLGLRGISDPAAHLAMLDMQLPTATALAEARAMYGGSSITLGLLIAWGVVSQRWLKPALLITGVFMGGLASGRLVGAMLDGPASTITLQFLGLEVAVCLLALWLRRQVKDDTF